jgi:hypothetical protein
LGRLGVVEVGAVGEERPHGWSGERPHAGHRQQHQVVAPQLFPPVVGLVGGALDPVLGGGEVGEQFGGLPAKGVQVEVPLPELGPRPGGRADLLGALLDAGDTAGVGGNHLGDR